MTAPASSLLQDHCILVTGAARGIGLAAAQALHAYGARAILSDADGALCEQNAEALPGATGLKLDVTSPHSIAEAVQHIEASVGALDGLINNAAVLNESHAASVTMDEMDGVMAVNGTSVLRLSQAMLPLLQRSKHAAIVNTLSTQSFYAQPNGIAYGAAKGAALALTRCMAVDFAPFGIRVNGVAPGFIDTRMALMPDGQHEHKTTLFKDFYIGARKIPMGRGGKPEECAGAFVYLLSNLSSYVTGQVIIVDGGLTATYY